MGALRLGVVFGGRSGEHEVSLVSAASVLHALDPAKYVIVPIGIEKNGRWRTGPSALAYLAGEITDVPALCYLPPDPFVRGLLVEDGHGSFRHEPLDVVFPVLHGPLGEDGCVQGLLELASIPYVGSGVLGSAVGMDKIAQKRLFAAAGLPVVETVSFRSEEYYTESGGIIHRIETALGYPVFVKPANLGSSVGISRATGRAELHDSIALAALYDRWVIVERAVHNAREIEVAVLGNASPEASVPGEIVPGNEFYDYAAKYMDGTSRCVIPAELPSDIAGRLRTLAVEAFLAAFCEGMARVDFLLSREDGALFVNEVNTIPGFTGISMYPKLFEAAGIAYPRLLDRLIELALEREREKAALRRTFEPPDRWYTQGAEGSERETR
ncbi:MAG: D-alanine--D-alanine ligase family protein [Bacteroidota bacterium]|nr:D-alanine--D-alanine ligase family protein [Bacteroidota bacterium]